MFKRWFKRKPTPEQDSASKELPNLEIFRRLLTTNEALKVRLRSKPLKQNHLALKLTSPEVSLEDLVARLQTWRLLEEANRAFPKDGTTITTYQITLDTLTITKENYYLDLEKVTDLLTKSVDGFARAMLINPNEDFGASRYNRQLTRDYALALTELLERLLNA